MEENIWELCNQIKNNDLEALDALYNHYLPLIQSIVSKLQLNTFEDSVSVEGDCKHALIKAVLSFNPEKGSLKKYASIIIKNYLIDHYIKQKPNEELNKGSSSVELLIEYGQENQIVETEEEIDENKVKLAFKVLNQILSHEERKIFVLVELQQQSIESVSKLLNKTTKQVYNALSRSKMKIKKYYENH